ncbi:efflux RND transporter permease subunit [Dechloromonas sp.]|uniref:efflux RND transporter permease subunit n=1 Tax=Dechloromonas sp. TaxID=1917218 RepID=UPI00122263A0|nr:efflux RND transporter permease subunit [Dechloromonas sp.]MBU3695747.1 efflux RND transporter permease subunit [Dechloromonas sp.]TEX46277.1 MAG: multidrug transporter AcrB [Rhodocyclaceae bacterium]
MSHRFNLSDWTLHHRTLVGYFLFAIALMGVVAYGRLSQAEDPPFTFKLMVIRSFWPGATAHQVEQQLTDRIERKLQETPGIERVSSYSRPGESTVLFVARDSTPPAQVPEIFYQVRKKVGDIRHTLPAGVQGPFFNDEYGDVLGNIYALTAEGFDYPQLKDQAERIRDELLRVPNVGKVEIFGIQDEKIYVDLANAKLATLGIDPASIMQALAQQNAVAGAGFFETDSERIQIRSLGAFDSVQAVADTLIRSNGRSFRLGDIARVHRGTVNPPATQVRYSGKPALAIGVSMVRGGDIIQLGKDLRQRIASIQRDLPVGIDIGESASQPDAVNRSIQAFVQALAEAVIVVLLVTFISLGLRTGMVVAISIPLVLAATFLAMNFFNVGLHKVSLGALVLALGLLVDDAIIAVEMMWVKMEQGWERTRAASFAYTSTAGPMLSGTLVTVAGFIPIALAKSSTGEYAFAFFQINAIALLISWLAAVVAIPWLGYKLLPDPRAARTPGQLERRVPHLAALLDRLGINGPAHAEDHDVYGTPFYRRFRTLVAWCVAHRWLVIGVTVLLFALSIVGMSKVQKQFFPNSTRLELNIELRLPEGSSITAIDHEARRLEAWLAEDNEQFDQFEHSLAYIGSGSPRYYLGLDQQLPATNVAQFVILTRSVEAREALRVRLIKLFETGDYAARANISRIENGPPVGYPVQYRVSGEDVQQLRAAAEKVAAAMRSVSALSNVNFDWNELSKAVRIDIDQDKARLLGISSQDIASTLNMALNGLAVTSYREGEKSIDVVLRGDEAERTRLASLADLSLPTRSGKSVPLSQVATLAHVFEPGLIWRRDRLPTITVRANLYGHTQPATVVGQLQPAIDEIQQQLPAGYRIAIGGSVEESAKGSGSVMAGLPLFVLAVITILMIQLQSVSRVLMVLLTAPLGLIGIALFLLVFNQPFGFMALLGTIALFGMIMRNSVILVDQIEQDLAAGKHRREAIVESTVRRFRPIVLTAAAAVLAMIPLSRNDFFGPMAVAIMGGLIVATALTLLFLPALYAAWYKVRA